MAMGDIGIAWPWVIGPRTPPPLEPAADSELAGTGRHPQARACASASLFCCFARSVRLSTYKPILNKFLVSMK